MILPKPTLQFSLAGLMLVTLVIALIVRFSRKEYPSGFEMRTRSVLLQNTQGLAKGYGDGSWQESTFTDGKGHYCHFSETGHGLGSDAAWSESFGIQLPEALPPDLIIPLRCIEGKDEEHLRQMEPGEMVASLYAHPMTCRIAVSKDGSSAGTLKIVSDDGKVVVAQLDVSLPVAGEKDPWEIKRELRLERVYGPDPWNSLPSKTARRE